MQSKGFIVNKKSLNCFPKDYTKFFEIKKMNYSHCSMNVSYWELYNKFMKPMN